MGRILSFLMDIQSLFSAASAQTEEGAVIRAILIGVAVLVVIVWIVKRLWSHA
jgi:hypothetical protein